MAKKQSIYIISLLLLLFSYKIGAQTRIDSIAQLKTIIQKNNIVSTQGVGFVNAPSKHWYSFSYLLCLATNEELEEMTNDKSPALRIYAYIGLSHNKYANLKEVKKRLSTDKEIVTSMEGCIGDETTVADGIKSIKKWYYEKSVTSFMNLLNKNEQYRIQLYEDLVSDRKISRPPYE